MSTRLASESLATPAHRLRATMAAVRVSFTWFGVRKSLTNEQKATAAEAFGAEGNYLSAGKKLLDTAHPAFRAVSAFRNTIVSYWKGVSLPYPEPGIRLIRQNDVAGFDIKLAELARKLNDAVVGLDEHYSHLKAAARERLGRLYAAHDYPHSLQGLFAVEWDFPSIEPPSYLRQLSPELYQQEAERVAGRFNEAVRLAEEAFFSELSKLVSHLAERLSGHEDSRPKIFRDSAVENLDEFFARFRTLNVGSSEQLEELVNAAQQIIRGIDPQQLRDEQGLRRQVATQLAAVQSTLDGLMVDRPRRNVLRRPREEASCR